MKKQKKKKHEKSNTPILQNRIARHEFEIIDTLIAGVVLTGTEVKSIRLGRGELRESFIRIDKSGEAYLYGMTIPKYEFGNINNHDPTRIRKILLTKKELMRWKSKADQEKLTIIILRLFFKNSLVKLEIALAKRKQLHDKRKDLKQKAVSLDLKRELK